MASIYMRVDATCLLRNSYVLLVELKLSVVVSDVVIRNGRWWIEHPKPDTETEEVAKSTLNLCLRRLAIFHRLSPYHITSAQHTFAHATSKNKCYS